MSLQRLAAPRATYSTVNAAVASVTSKLSWTVTTPPLSRRPYVPVSPVHAPTVGNCEGS